MHNAIDLRLLKFLKDALDIHTGDIYFIKGPLDATFFMKISSLKKDESLLYKHYEPQQIETFPDGEAFFFISSQGTGYFYFTTLMNH